VLQRILDSTGKHVFEGYGLTEAGPTVSSTLMSEVPKPGSIGRPVPGVHVRLVEPTGLPGAAEVDADDPGEIQISGDNLFSGYWPEAAAGPDEEGWWSTGDLAYADADGDLHLVDRKREVILVSGFNVYPREVEQVLVEHPDVEDAAVLGMPHPYTGEAVRALVIRRPGSDLSVEELGAFAAERLARFKCPTTIEFVAELPYTAMGRMRRAALRDAATSGPGGTGREAS
jgi:long-chain acyl-CoA synthetase